MATTKADYTCTRCGKAVRTRDWVVETSHCRWCEFAIEVELAIMLDDRDGAEMALLKYRSIAPVTIADIGRWPEARMLRDAFGG